MAVHSYRVAELDGPTELPQTCELPPQSVATSENRLLASLPRAVRARLEHHLEPVLVHRHEVLFHRHEPVTVVYFPRTAVVSLVSTLGSGESLEVGLIGRDGVAPTAVFPGISTMSCDGVVRIPGLACRISADILRHEAQAEPCLHSTLGRYAHVLLARSMQISVCNAFHSVEQRCVRWLLTISDLLGQSQIPLTHELVATTLGVHRPTVTLVLRSLHNAGVLTERRGRIAIRDRGRLEQACCECYWAMRAEQRRLLGY